MKQMGVKPVRKRQVHAKRVKWCKTNGYEMLEEQDWIGKWIPVVRVIGNEFEVDGKLYVSGLVRNAKDAQRMYNYWTSQEAEMLALAPKAPFIGYGGQFEGYEMQWKTANTQNWPYLEVNPDVTDGSGAVLPLPQRAAPPLPQTGLIQAKMGASDDIKSTTGQYDTSLGATSNERSGKAIMARERQSDTGTYHYVDNLARAIRHVTRQIVDLIPKIYDTQRVMRIIGSDGQPDMTTINEKNAIGEVLNDVTVGEYDVVMDTGPGFQTKRQQAVESMMPLLTGNQELFNIAGDLVFRNMDFPGADVIADRLAAMNPMANIDEKSDIPPEAQMRLAQSEQMIQQLQQQLQAAGLEINNRAQVAQIKEEGATRRKLMDVTARAHNTETMAEVRVNDQNTRSITSQNKTEIDALVKILLARMSPDQLMGEIERLNAEQFQYANIAAQDISHQPNPFIQGMQQ